MGKPRGGHRPMLEILKKTAILPGLRHWHQLGATRHSWEMIIAAIEHWFRLLVAVFAGAGADC